MKRKKVIVHVRGGICNRLRTLVSGKILAEDLERDLKVLWPVRRFCRWSDLFETKIPLITSSKEFAPTSVKVIRDADLSEIQKLSKDTPYGIIYISTCNRFCITKFMDGQKFGERFRESLNLLVAKKSIRDRVMALPENTVGVHIRRGDHKICGEVSTNLSFIKQMDLLLEKDKNTYFFLSTDDEDVKKSFVNRYKDRILTYDIDCRRDSVTGMQDALLDLITLSKTKMILGSYWSSYSYLATQFNLIPLYYMGKNVVT